MKKKIIYSFAVAAAFILVSTCLFSPVSAKKILMQEIQMIIISVIILNHLQIT
jgi:hypothetical protein